METKPKKCKCFISGKVTGMRYDIAQRAFQSAEDKLKHIGYKPVNPTKLCKPYWGWRRCMIVCLWNLLWCSHITMLDNWVDSRGARIENKVAKFLHKKFIEL